MKSTIAYIGIGSNVGERHRTIEEALRMLRAQSHITVHAVAPLYETTPVGVAEPQPMYLNTVARIETTFLPESLLRTLLDIERTLGRVRTVRWAPREIDLDVLLYGAQHWATDTLTVPHPRMMERAFVLVPLLDIMPVPERQWIPALRTAQIAHEEVKRWRISP
jgi:2-amino-4-hydroxy-6-hydroxymethyldihydropteridine diphosphokinase